MADLRQLLYFVCPNKVYIVSVWMCKYTVNIITYFQMNEVVNFEAPLYYIFNILLIFLFSLDIKSIYGIHCVISEKFWKSIDRRIDITKSVLRYHKIWILKLGMILQYHKIYLV